MKSDTNFIKMKEKATLSSIAAPGRIGARRITWIIFRAEASNAEPEKNDGGKKNAETVASGSAPGPACALMMIDK